MVTINPYLNFNGTAEDAFNFYKSVFGGEFNALQRYKEMPPGEQATATKNEGEKIMHISLPISKETSLMGSDIPGEFPSVAIGDNFAISVDTESMQEAKKIFKGLGEGGVIKMPFEKAFWGSHFGMLHDKYGIQWMVSYDPNVKNKEVKEMDEPIHNFA